MQTVMSSNIEVRLISLDKKLVFTLRDCSAKLQDLVATLSSDHEKAKGTFMIFWNGYLRFYCEPSSYHVSTLHDQDDSIEGKQVLYLDLDGMDIETIRRYTSLYDASRLMNCITTFALKGKRFVITITPLDDTCSNALACIDHSAS